MDQPRVSVVLPVYNGAEYLADAMASVLAQDMADLELIVIDDGSRDGSLAIMQAIAQRDPRVRVISRENRGLVHTLNEGVQAARAPWVARMDQDDLCVPGRLRLQLDYAGRENLDVCGGWVRTFGDTRPRVRRFPAGHEALRLQLLFNTCFAHPAVLARREVLLAHPYDPAVVHAEDYELWTRLAAAGARLGTCPQRVLHYRVHAEQTTVTRRAVQDAARARIAEAYRQRLFPAFGAAGEHAAIVSRLELLPTATVLAAVRALVALRDATGDPEGVIGDNLFVFLGRHAEIGAGGMHAALRLFSLSWPRRLVLYALGLLRAHQRTALFEFIYRNR